MLKALRGLGDILREYMAIVFVKFWRSLIFFLSVTALMCFVLDHLLWPADWAGVAVNFR